MSLLESWHVRSIYANLEYEVDELRRDIRFCEIGKTKGVKCVFVHDRLVVEPGVLATQQGKPYTVRLFNYTRQSVLIRFVGL